MSSKKRRLIHEVRHGNEIEAAPATVDYKVLYEEALARISFLEETIALNEDERRRAITAVKRALEHPRTTADVLDDLKEAIASSNKTSQS